MNLYQAEIDKILETYIQPAFYEELVKAKAEYMSVAGTIDEELPEYEARMNCFNDWFIFQYKKNPDQTILENQIAKNKVSSDLIQNFQNFRYSLFHFLKINYKKEVILYDILKDEKILIAKDNGDLGLVVDDIFVGRVIPHEKTYYILKGLCLLPNEIHSALKKECKKIRKSGNIHQSESFLLNLERLKARSLQYSHIEVSKIFTF